MADPDAPNRLRVLLVDDDEDDHILTRQLLSEVSGVHFDLDWVSTYDEAIEAIERAEHDVYLVDYHLGARSGIDVVRKAEQLGIRAPLIMLTGEGGEEADREALRCGAADYLIKGELGAPLLGRSIRYAIERKRTELRLANMAQYDELTGLVNRALFKELVTHALARTKRLQASVALMFFDLDNFKTINDTLGHSAGDLLLREVAERLKECLRESDVIARLGGDEFVVILESVSRVREAALVAERILEALSAPYDLDGQEIFVTASIGIAKYDGKEQDVETLIKHADMAMYRAKEEGRNRYHFHTAEMTAEAMERLTLENSLRRALDRNEFVLNYQPQIDLRTGKVSAVEALIRWRHPELGQIPPQRFISVAEEAGLMVSLGYWVLRAACAQAQAWQRMGLPPLRVAVNLSTRQFQDDSLARTIEQVLADASLDPSFLELELTEGPLARDPEQAVRTLAELREMGIRVSIDDFGTGHSSLSHLKRFSLDALKIDRSFVAGVPGDREDSAIVRAITVLAHTLQLEVVAEGVETDAQLNFLREQGCDTAQGYLISYPIDADALADWIVERRPSELVHAG